LILDNKRKIKEDAQNVSSDLQKSLRLHQEREEELKLEDERKQFLEWKKHPKYATDNINEHDIGGAELIAAKTEMNLDEHNKISNKALVSEQTVSKVQAQLEGKVQQLLDELTVLVNNKYSKGKHTYDYQLVRLTEGQMKEEHEALDKADEIYFKHSQLKKQEMEMDKKFEGTEATLKIYKQSFDKQKKSL